MWFQVDEEALHDPRYGLVAERLSVSRGDAFRACCLVWCWLYKRGEGDVMTPREVDIAGELVGLGVAMAEEKLADYVPNGLRIHGGRRAKRYQAFRVLQREKAIAREAKKREKCSEADVRAPAVPPNEHQEGSIYLSDRSSSLRSGSPDSQDLSEYLLTAIRTHTPGLKGNVERWARDIELALRIDGRTPDEIRSVVDYAHRNPDGAFWASNLLSGQKLRKHCERLLIALRKAPRSAVAGGNEGGRVMTAEELAEWAAEEMARERERGER